MVVTQSHKLDSGNMTLLDRIQAREGALWRTLEGMPRIIHGRIPV